MSSREWQDLTEPLQAALSDAWAAKQKADRLNRLQQQQAGEDGGGGGSGVPGDVRSPEVGVAAAPAVGFVGQVEWLLLPSGQWGCLGDAVGDTCVKTCNRFTDWVIGLRNAGCNTGNYRRQHAQLSRSSWRYWGCGECTGGQPLGYSDLEVWDLCTLAHVCLKGRAALLPT
jgi:hypothetical protein